MRVCAAVDARNPVMHAEYARMLELLQAEDLWLKGGAGREHPVTIGEAVEGLPFETALTQSGDFCSEQCVDFILFRPDEAGRVTATAAAVERFEAAADDSPYKILSDHYGVSTTVCVSAAC